MREPIRVGIVGFGRMGRVRKAAIEESRALSLRVVCDPVAAEDLPRGCRLERDYRAVLDSGDVDAVFICTPNHVTSEVVVAALEAGKHVLCEKPPGRTPEDVRRIIEAEARRPKLKLKFGFNHRYHDAVREAAAIVEGGRLGRLLWMRGVYGKSGGTDFEKSWRSRRQTAGGGILLDQGIHMLDLFRLFAGEFDEVKSFVTRSYWPIDVEDNAFALLRNAHNQVAMLHSSSTQWKHVFSLEIFLSEGYVTISGILSGTRSYGRETLVVARKQPEHESFALGNPREEITYFDRDLSWQREVTEFSECILTDTPVRVGSSRDALQVMDLVYRIYRNDASWLVQMSPARLVGFPPGTTGTEPPRP